MILGIDTSGTALGVALAKDGVVLASMHVYLRNSHDALLVPVIARVCETCAVQAADIAGVAVSAGPGSFTGLRIGFAAAKGFALAHGTPLLAVPTFDAMARSVHALLPPGGAVQALAALTDARRGDVYIAEYTLGEDVTCIHSASAETAHAVGARLPKDALLCGDGASIVGAAYPGKFRILGVGLSANIAGAVAQCGADMLREGRIADAATCEPQYVREFQTTVPHHGAM